VRTQKEHKGLSIFSRLLIAFVGVVIVMGGALTAVFYVHSRKSVEKQTEEYVRQQFQTVSYHFRSDLRDALVKDLQLLNSNPLLDDFLMSSHEEREVNARGLERFFLESLKTSRSYQSIAFVDAVGKEAVKVDWSGRVRTLRDAGKTPLFRRLSAARPGSIDVEGPAVDTYGNLLISIGINKTDADIGKFGGAVVIEYSLEEFFNYVDRLKIFDENPLWLFAPDGKALKQPWNSGASFDPRPFLASPFQRDPLLAIAEPGMLVYQDLSVIPDRPLLRLAAGIPSSLLLRDVQDVLRFFFAVFAAAIVIISAIAFYLARYLSRPIVELARAEARLQSYSEELEETNEELKNFAYIISHDLRAPLVNIKGFSDELLFGIKEIKPLLEKYLGEFEGRERLAFGLVLEKDIPEALQFIGSSVNRMDSLLNAVLQLSRVGRRKLNPESLRTGDLVGTVLQSLAHQLESRSASVTVGGLPDLIADKTAVEQIFGNLLDNAVKYLDTDRPGRIAVSAESAGEDIVFRVEDNGRGMTKEDIPKAFEIFRRVGRQDVPGEGMGLAYVKALVRLLGGRIWCESEPGAGTTFSFTLPLSVRKNAEQAGAKAGLDALLS
jgi:signal transduction histidine kinase